MARFVWLYILLGALAAAGASYYTNFSDESEQADHLSQQLTGRLNDQLAMLDGVRALFVIADADHDQLIRKYLDQLQGKTRLSGIQGIGIVMATPRDALARSEARITRTYGLPARVWPDSQQAVAYPITLLEPLNELNRAALGFDMYSEPIRRAAIQRGAATGQFTTSGIVQLVQDDIAGRSQPGFLIYLPVTPPGPPPAREGSANYAPALVYAAVRISDFIDSSLGHRLPGIKGIEIYAGPQADAPLVYQRGKIQWGAQKTSIRVADRQWSMVISYDRTFGRIVRPLIVALVGIILAALVIQLTRTHRRRLAALRVFAEEKARHAEDRELILGEMGHRLKNAFARIAALTRITVRESSSLQDFETRFEGRLRALADTKQLMLTGAFTEVDLCRIIQRELELAGWNAAMRESVAGPMIQLDDEGAQTIALVIHELVTNSIKYGALSAAANLSVSWRREGRMIELRWLETSLPSTPIFGQESFGTRFIRSLIERQLKGEWQRTVKDRELQILIRWPERYDLPPAD